jgi:hypothetical protein
MLLLEVVVRERSPEEGGAGLVAQGPLLGLVLLPLES